VKKAHSILSWISLSFWAALGGIRLATSWQGRQLTVLLLAVQSILVSWLLLTRRSERTDVAWIRKMVAWSSALLPLGMRVYRETPASQAAMTLGLLLIVWSLLTLGVCFGIAPADRGLVTHGPYRMIRHPMYLGEIICLAGLVLSNPSGWNACLLLVLILTFWLRIRWEEQVVGNYASYCGQVRWRLIPWIW
jgi:protein-S-isoprenylcysteine O-methyltransferase Ste14